MGSDLDGLLAAPPPVHPGAPGGVWGTDRSCYEFIAEHVGPGSATLETGCGISTAWFAMLGCSHTAIFFGKDEGERLVLWADESGITLDRVTLHHGGSENVLPNLEFVPLDLVFIDGCHGYPMPQLDWLYAGSRLRRGGVMIVDDTQLWAPAHLRDFVDADARWTRIGGTSKWAAWRRESDGALAEEWDAQPFAKRRSVPKPRALIGKHVVRPVRRALGR